MARYVIVSFEDNTEAERFVQESELHNVDKYGEPFEYYGINVVGLFAKPTLFCEGCRSGNKRVQGFFRGPKYGWWCCVTCGKPKRSQTEEKLMRNVLSQGRNFITQPQVDEISTNYPPSDVASVYDEGWGASNRG